MYYERIRLLMTTANPAVSPAAAPRSRNQAMECCKMAAAILVVFLHVRFPGEAGRFIERTVCFAVPIFFAITGYFNYGANHAAVARRMKHILWLYLVAVGVDLAVRVFAAAYVGDDILHYLIWYFPRPEEWANLLVFHAAPRGGQLWYLIALCLCYAVLWLYVRFFGEETVDYRPLYGVGMALFSVLLALGILAPAAGMDMPYLLYRNGYFVGLPMFIFGIFIHQYQERILKNYQLTTKKLIGLTLLGGILGIFQGYTVGMGQMPLGTVIEVAALMMLLVSHPVLIDHGGIWTAVVSKFGSWSTYIYLFHLTVYERYVQFFQDPLAAAFPKAEPCLRPVIIAIVSLLVAVAAERIQWLLKRHA